MSEAIKWQDDDEFGTTFGTLRKALAEARTAGAEEEAQRIIDALEAALAEFTAAPERLASGEARGIRLGLKRALQIAQEGQK